MKITINKQELETNPTGVNTSVVFKGTVHNGTEQVIDVYGFTEEDVIKLAREVKYLNKDYNIVHIYGPENIWANRTYIGVKFLD